MKSTDEFKNATETHLLPSTWASHTPLIHRRVLVLFNELHSDGDGLGFKKWLSNPDLWFIAGDWNTTEDDESTAIIFMYRLVCTIWELVIQEWKNTVDQCADHIKQSVCSYLLKATDVALFYYHVNCLGAFSTRIRSHGRRTRTSCTDYLERLCRLVDHEPTDASTKENGSEDQQLLGQSLEVRKFVTCQSNSNGGLTIEHDSC
jgi:hypothetical protein